LQLQLAKNAAGGNYYLNSILDERIETIRNEQRENKEKEKDSPF
jgi:hypothetical protein